MYTPVCRARRGARRHRRRRRCCRRPLFAIVTIAARKNKTKNENKNEEMKREGERRDGIAENRVNLLIGR